MGRSASLLSMRSVKVCGTRFYTTSCCSPGCSSGLSVLLADLSITEHHKVIADMGLAAINLIGVIIAIFVGISLVNKEIERRTIYTIMARPISRTFFILGSISVGTDAFRESGHYAGGVSAHLWLYHVPVERLCSKPSNSSL